MDLIISNTQYFLLLNKNISKYKNKVLCITKPYNYFFNGHLYKQIVNKKSKTNVLPLYPNKIHKQKNYQLLFLEALLIINRPL